MVPAGGQDPYLVKARSLYPGATLAGIGRGSGATAAGGRPVWQRAMDKRGEERAILQLERRSVVPLPRSRLSDTKPIWRRTINCPISASAHSSAEASYILNIKHFYA